MNLVSIIVATAVGMGIGALWYSPRLFGNQWMQELKIDPKKMSQSTTGAYIFTAIGALITTIVLGQLIRIFSTTPSAMDGALVGLLAGIGLVTPAIATNHLFEGKSHRLFLITAGHHIVTLLAKGLVIGLLS